MSSHTYELTHLEALEAESIHIIREVAAEFERPVLLFSGGKDSVVMLRLAEKAFWPAQIPFPVMHVDTGHNFPEVLEFRDRAVEQLGVRLVVGQRRRRRSTKGRVVEETGPDAVRNRLQTATLLDAIEEHGFDAVFGGARRDEEKARAKERVYSLPRRVRPVGPEEPAPRAVEPLQRPAPQGRAHPGLPAVATGPSSTSGSTSRDEDIELPSIYFAHQREVFRRDGMLLAVSRLRHAAARARRSFEATVRYRTVGDVTCTGAVESTRGDDRRGHRRGRRDPHHRARRHPRRRPVLRGRHGRPQAGGLLLRWSCCASRRPARSTTASRR